MCGIIREEAVKVIPDGLDEKLPVRLSASA